MASYLRRIRAGPRSNMRRLLIDTKFVARARLSRSHSLAYWLQMTGWRTTEVWTVLAATAGAMSFACSPHSGASPKMEWSMPPDGKQSIAVASQMRVLFAHQSVGANILEGLRHLLEDAGATWPIMDLGAAKSQPGPGVIDTRPGNNGSPKTKIDGFEEALDGLRGSPPQIALMKFCYVDFARDTDIRDLFDYYKRAIARIKARHPAVIIAHATVPLRIREQGVKTRLKRLLGLRPDSDLINAKREQYNRLLRTEFANEPIFDIARAESTDLNGTRETYPIDGQPTPALVAEYSSDGGHLNPLGMRVLASAYVRFLAAAAPAQRK